MSVAATIIFCAIAIFSFILLWREGLVSDRRHMVSAYLLLLAAFAVRVFFISYETLDYQNFLTHWVNYFRSSGGFKALSDSVGNYNLPYLYFLAAFSYFKTSDLHLIKLLSIAFDVFLAYASMKLVGVFTKSGFKRLFVYLAVLLLPTVVLNGAVWGQCDSIYTAFGVMSIYCALSKRPWASVVCIALSFAFKLQAIFIMPVFLILLYTGRVKIRHLLAFPATYIIVVLPAVIAGRPFIDTITLYFNQAGSIGSGLNYNSPSIYAFVTGEVDIQLYSNLGILAAFAFLGLVFIWLYVKKSKTDDTVILFATLLIVVGVPFFLPHMHDRYFFPSDIFSLVLAVVLPRYFPLPALVSFASLLGYHAYLKMRYFLPMRYGSLALIAVMIAGALGATARLRGSGVLKK